MRRYLVLAVFGFQVVVSLIAGGCAGDPTRSSEYQELAAELDAAQATSESLASDVAERDVTISELQAALDDLTDGIEDLEAESIRLEGALDDFLRPFSFSAEDDLTLWVTETEMTTLLRELSTTYAHESLDTEAALVAGGPEAFDWEAAPWKVNVTAADPSWPYDRTHPALPDGVLLSGGDWSIYNFVGPYSDEALNLILWGSPDEEPVLAVAAMLLREMGWAD